MKKVKKRKLNKPLVFGTRGKKLFNTIRSQFLSVGKHVVKNPEHFNNLSLKSGIASRRHRKILNTCFLLKSGNTLENFTPKRGDKSKYIKKMYKLKEEKHNRILNGKKYLKELGFTLIE